MTDKIENHSLFLVMDSGVILEKYRDQFEDNRTPHVASSDILLMEGAFGDGTIADKSVLLIKNKKVNLMIKELNLDQSGESFALIQSFKKASVDNNKEEMHDSIINKTIIYEYNKILPNENTNKISNNENNKDYYWDIYLSCKDEGHFDVKFGLFNIDFKMIGVFFWKLKLRHI